MSEQKLREALGNLGPNDETRQRLLQNILAAAEERTVLLDGVQSDPTPRLEKNRRTTSKKRKKFSLIKYALPVAACLVLATAFPVYLPQLAELLDNPPTPVQTEIPNDNQHEEYPDTSQEEVPSMAEPSVSQVENEDPYTSPIYTAPAPTYDTPVPSALAPPDNSEMIDLVSFALSTLAALLALVFVVLGVVAWRRSKK